MGLDVFDDVYGEIRREVCRIWGIYNKTKSLRDLNKLRNAMSGIEALFIIGDAACAACSSSWNPIPCGPEIDTACYILGLCNLILALDGNALIALAQFFGCQL